MTKDEMNKHIESLKAEIVSITLVKEKRESEASTERISKRKITETYNKLTEEHLALSRKLKLIDQTLRTYLVLNYPESIKDNNLSDYSNYIPEPVDIPEQDYRLVNYLLNYI